MAASVGLITENGTLAAEETDSPAASGEVDEVDEVDGADDVGVAGSSAALCGFSPLLFAA